MISQQNNNSCEVVNLYLKSRSQQYLNTMGGGGGGGGGWGEKRSKEDETLYFVSISTVRFSTSLLTTGIPK